MSDIEWDHHRGKGSREDLLRRIGELEAQVAKVQVPHAYASELYTLRHHILLIRDLVQKRES
ncbi:MAG: hypothetical protein HC904_03615 [Blastochloris sp.]|nr:hypothetical protein [Blastochloris sp.]